MGWLIEILTGLWCFRRNDGHNACHGQILWLITICVFCNVFFGITDFRLRGVSTCGKVRLELKLIDFILTRNFYKNLRCINTLRLLRVNVIFRILFTCLRTMSSSWPQELLMTQRFKIIFQKPKSRSSIFLWKPWISRARVKPTIHIFECISAEFWELINLLLLDWKWLLVLAGGLNKNKESVESLFDDCDESGTRIIKVNN